MAKQGAINEATWGGNPGGVAWPLPSPRLAANATPRQPCAKLPPPAQELHPRQLMTHAAGRAASWGGDRPLSLSPATGAAAVGPLPASSPTAAAATPERPGWGLLAKRRGMKSGVQVPAAPTCGSVQREAAGGGLAGRPFTGHRGPMPKDPTFCTAAQPTAGGETAMPNKLLLYSAQNYVKEHIYPILAASFPNTEMVEVWRGTPGSRQFTRGSSACI